jgi:hypothetical protein
LSGAFRKSKRLTEQVFVPAEASDTQDLAGPGFSRLWPAYQPDDEAEQWKNKDQQDPKKLRQPAGTASQNLDDRPYIENEYDNA